MLILQERVQNLQENVLKCLHSIPLDIYWKVCCFIREYKLAYCCLAQQKEIEESNNNYENDKFYGRLKLEEIEKIKKFIKSKQSVDKQDKKLVVAVQELIDLTAESCDEVVKCEHESLKKILKIEKNV